MARVDAQSYDRLADHYEELTSLHGGDRLDWIESILPAARGSAVDLGCGTGRHVLHLSSFFESVVGVDLSKPMVEYAVTHRAAPNVSYLVSDLRDVAGSFDFVLSVATLHHVSDLSAALSRVRSLVAPGGRAVLVDLLIPSRLHYRLAHRFVPRLLYRTGAVVGLLSGLRARRADAWRRYRVETFKPWLDHLASDRFLTREQFESAYARELPGASFRWPPGRGVCVWDASAG